MIYRSSYDPISKEILHDYLDTRFFIEEKSKYCESIFEGSDIVLEDGEKKNIFEKIGQAILDIIKKCGEFLSKIIDKLTGMGFEGKSQIVKAEKLIKRHPEFKDQLMEALQNGDLDLTEIKNVKELDEAATEIIHLASLQKMNPDSIKTKWAKAWNKFKKSMEDGTAKNVLTTVTTAGGAAGALLLFKHKYDKMKQEAINLKNSNAEKGTKLAELIDKVDEMDKNMRASNLETQLRLRALETVVSQSSSAVTETVNRTMGKFTKGLGLITGEIKKLSKKADDIEKSVTRVENKVGRGANKK